jgi:hypothetical protein
MSERVTNYIFLDIDGVLNNSQSSDNICLPESDELFVSQSIARRFGDFASQVNARIVLVSDWRFAPLPLDEIFSFLSRVTGIKRGQFVGAIDPEGRHEMRDVPVAGFVAENHIPIKNFIILDDMATLYGSPHQIVSKRLVNTNPSTGFSDSDCQRARLLLN